MPTALSAPLGFRAWVTVGGAPVELYKSKANPSKLSAYIESTSGVEFVVHFADDRSSRTPVGASLYLDGTECEAYCLDPDQKSARTATYSGKRDTPTTMRPYKFADVQLTDDDDIAVNEERIIKAMGTIQIKVCRVRKTGTSASIAYPADKAKILNEKSKKAVLSHATGFGAAKHVPPVNGMTVEWIDSKQEPLITFEFLYRSRTLLELNDIVPAGPSPVVKAKPEPSSPAPPIAGPSNPKKKRPLRQTPDTITLDSDEDEDPLEELARLRAENAALKGIKAEPETKRIKKETETIVIEDDDD